jgi:hypothetical protein
MLMVIFGAGASYDSFSSVPPGPPGDPGDRIRYPHRPPIANELFDFGEFRGLLDKYPQCRPLIPLLEKASNVEDVMGGWQANADDMRLRQLAAIRYYLRDLIHWCQGQWRVVTRGVSNYGTILDQVRSHPKVSLVTFNYDTMIEEALVDLRVRIDSMDGYLADRQFKLFKLHGSIDWVQRASFKGRGRDHRWNSAAEIIDYAPDLEPTTNFDRFGNGSLPTVLQVPDVVVRLIPLIPALAIPTAVKSTFICPRDHLETLREAIPQVTRILIVGWKAAEQHFLELLAQGLGGRGVKVLRFAEELMVPTRRFELWKTPVSRETFGRTQEGSPIS